MALTGSARSRPRFRFVWLSFDRLTRTMTHDELPDTDPDRRLAAVLGARLAAGHTSGDSEKLDDATQDEAATDEAARDDDKRFLELLRRSGAQRLAGVEAPPSEAMWAAVAAGMAPRPAARIYRLADWRWRTVAVAAVVLALFTFAVLQLTQPEFRTLLESGSERAVYTTADGSTITLRPNSRLLMNREEIFEVVGEGYFSVAPQESGEFVVVTQDASVSVLGTRFVVATWSGNTDVFLEEGRIRLDARGGSSSETLAPGDSRSVGADGMIRNLATDSVEALDWLRDEMSFDSQPLGTIVAELAHHFDLTIVVPEEETGTQLSGRILLTSQREALNDLATILDAEFVIRDGAFMLERRAR